VAKGKAARHDDGARHNPPNFHGRRRLWALQSHYKLQKGVINTQSVFRFNELATGVAFAIVGDRQVKKAHGTVAARRIGPNRVEVTFRVS
jgi:hypothetical protein